jgi:uncharacterized protein (TIGR02271 family)
MLFPAYRLPQLCQAAMGTGDALNDSRTIPVTEDVLVVGRKTVDVAKVTVSKTVDEQQAVVNEPAIHEDVQIERRRVDRPVSPDNVPNVRVEGDTTIIPVLEEVVVVEKRLVLREEVRITRVRREIPASQRVTVRRENVHVERSPAPSAPTPDDPPHPQE